jgi:hypothetical protein
MSGRTPINRGIVRLRNANHPGSSWTHTLSASSLTNTGSAAPRLIADATARFATDAPALASGLGNSYWRGYFFAEELCGSARGKCRHQPASAGACPPGLPASGGREGDHLSANGAGSSRRFTPGPRATAGGRIHSARGRRAPYPASCGNAQAGLAGYPGVGKAGSFELARSPERDAGPSSLISRPSTATGDIRSWPDVACRPKAETPSRCTQSIAINAGDPSQGLSPLMGRARFQLLV